MLVLFETPAGHALFKVLDASKLTDPTQIFQNFSTPAQAHSLVQLVSFTKFQNTAEALSAATALVEGQLTKDLKKQIKKELKDNSDLVVGVADQKLAASLAKKMGIQVVADEATMELHRGIRQHVTSLITGLSEEDLKAMSLGLAHSLSRYRIMFSPDKVDTMIVQAIGLLDDLDKELNTYSMRLKEWYGWHFPEMSKTVVDNAAFARIVLMMGERTGAHDANLESIIPEELAVAVRGAAEVSMGTEISEEDIVNIKHLAEQVVSLTEYRVELAEYLRSRMMAIAPNLTCLVGELVGARLIAKAGSLINLAKQPASTVQILGAEKALFRALKAKHNTPKYGLIYHASLVGQAAPKAKGKISRVLAAKCSLSIRVDALGETSGEIGAQHRIMVEQRLRQIESQSKGGMSVRKEGMKSANYSVGKGFNSDLDVVFEKKNEKVESKEEKVVESKKKEKVESKEEKVAKEDKVESKEEKKKKKKEKKLEKSKKRTNTDEQPKVKKSKNE